MTRSGYVTTFSATVLCAALAVPLPAADFVAPPPGAAGSSAPASPGTVPVKPPAGTQSKTPLTVVADAGVKNDGPAVGMVDFGAVDSLSKPDIAHDFTLRNDNKTPVSIVSLQPTCGCTSVLLGEGNETAKTLAPGEQVKVHVTVNVSRFRGPIFKEVRVFGADYGVPLATLAITAQVKEPVTFSANQLEFGKVTAGTSRSMPLTMTLSPGIVAKGIPATLMSSEPYVQVSAPLPNTARPKPAGAGAPPAAGAVEQHYLVTVSPKAPIGPIMGRLMLMPSAPAAANAVPANGVPATDAQPDITAALQMASVPFAAEVVGKIAATPNMVYFGTNKDAKEQVTLTSATPRLLQNLKLDSSSPWVLVRVVPATPGTKGGKGGSAVLEVSLSPKTPAGNLSTQVLVTTTDGERLEIPISAYIMPPPATPAPATPPAATPQAQ